MQFSELYELVKKYIKMIFMKLLYKVTSSFHDRCHLTFQPPTTILPFIAFFFIIKHNNFIQNPSTYKT